MPADGDPPLDATVDAMERLCRQPKGRIHRRITTPSWWPLPDHAAPGSAIPARRIRLGESGSARLRRGCRCRRL